MRKITSLFLTAALMLPFIQVSAEEIGVPKAKRPWTLGAGVVWRDRIYQDYDSDERTSVFPLILYEGQRFYVRANKLGWKFIDNETWEISVLGEAWTDGYDSNDSDFLDGMDDRDPSFAAGGNVEWRNGRFGIGLTATADVSDKSSGTQARAMAKWADRAGAWFYGLQGGVVWYDDDFVDYYFGVDSSEALPGRPVYEPDSETSFRTIATLGYQRPQSPWLFLIGGRYELYGDEVDDSPIVDDDGEAMLFGGVGYTFGR